MKKTKAKKILSRVRPCWHTHFLDIAAVVAKRSHDIHTQCGCVIVDDYHHIVSCGYNGFVGGIDDSGLPLNRPAKYAYMIHAEENAILNATGSLRNCTAYITAHPCLHCLQLLWQAGIRTIIYDGGGKQPKISREDKEKIEGLVALMPELFFYRYTRAKQPDAFNVLQEIYTYRMRCVEKQSTYSGEVDDD